MAQQAESLFRFSRERILTELNRLLLGEFPDHGLDVLRRTGVLGIAIPELEPLLARPKAP